MSTQTPSTIDARCHCGKNVLAIAGEWPAELTRCTCSICAARGALYAYYEPEQLTVVRSDADAIYRWNTKLVAHHFCAECGCTTYTDSPAFQPEAAGTAEPQDRRQRAPVPGLRCGDGAGQGDRRQEPLVAVRRGAHASGGTFSTAIRIRERSASAPHQIADSKTDRARVTQ